MAARYWSGNATGTSPNWSYNSGGLTNWSSASGITPDNVAPPTSADDVYFDGNTGGGLAPNANTNSTISATITVLSLTITSGYTATMTHNAVVIITGGNWTMNNTHTIAGTSSLTFAGAGTITSNGQTWPNDLTFSGNGTTTISGDLTISGRVIKPTNSITIVNATTNEKLYTNGWYASNLNGSTTGTITVVLTGGTVERSSASGSMSIGVDNIEIDGSPTFASGQTIIIASSVKYVSGSPVFTGCTIYITGTSNWDINGMVIESVSVNATTTLLSNMEVGSVSISGGNARWTVNKTVAETLTITNGLSMTSTSNGGLLGTASVIMTGGTWSTNSNSTNRVSVPFTIKGSITVSGDVYFNNNTLTFDNTGTGSPFTVTTTSSKLWLTVNPCTLNTNGITWNNVETGITVTLTSNFTATGTTTCSASTTINVTTSETWSTAGITANAAVSGTAKIILTGGTWSGTNTTGIANNLDLQGNVTISGNVYYRTGTLTYVSGTITVTSSTLNITGSCTLNTNGMSWNNITITGTATITLSGNIIADGVTLADAATVINGSYTWSTNGLTVQNQITGNFTKFILTGGTWLSTTGTSPRFNIDFNSAGTITISSASVIRWTGTMTYVAGTVISTNSQFLMIGGAGSVFNINGIALHDIDLRSNVTLTSNLLLNGQLICPSSAPVINRTTSETLSCNGLIASTNVTGTAELIMLSGTLSSTHSSGISNNLTIDAGVSTVTLSTIVNYQIGTFRYLSGTVVTTNSTLGLTDSCTLNTDGIDFNNVTCSSSTGKTYTINSNLSILGTLTIGVATSITVTFSGTHGWTTAILSWPATVSGTVTLKDGNTYTITSLFSCYTARVGSIPLFTSSHASLRANILMPNNGNNLCNVLASFTRIDASGGRSINTFGGTITDCINVNQYYDYKGVAV